MDSCIFIQLLYSLSSPCLSQSPASSQTSHLTLWLCRFLALHKIKCQWGVSISWDQSFKSWLLLSMSFMTHTFTNVLGRLWCTDIHAFDEKIEVSQKYSGIQKPETAWKMLYCHVNLEIIWKSKDSGGKWLLLGFCCYSKHRGTFLASNHG